MQQASRPHYAPITLCVAFDGFRLDTIDTGEATVRVRYGGNDFTVIAPDLRGYGDSSKPPTTTDHEPYSKRAMARDMVALLDHFGFPTFGVAGHDRGGRVAYRLALDYPQRVSRLAVLDILPTSEHFRRTDTAEPASLLCAAGRRGLPALLRAARHDPRDVRGLSRRRDVRLRVANCRSGTRCWPCGVIGPTTCAAVASIRATTWPRKHRTRRTPSQVPFFEAEAPVAWQYASTNRGHGDRRGCIL